MQTLSLPAISTPVILLLAAAVLTADASDWPHWRGPTHAGISSETGWSTAWPPAGPPVVWKTAVGAGLSSVSVSDGRVFTVGHAGETDQVFCLDANTGKTLWKHAYDSDLGDKYFDGGPTATPTVDGNAIYVLSRWGDVFCFESATGKIRWSKNVQKETGVKIPDWGFSGSPLVHGRFLLLNVGDAGLALDKVTGTLAWKSANKEAGYSTPLPVRRNGETFAVMSSTRSYLAVDIATGKELWRFPWPTQYDVNAADPIVHGDLVLISTGYGKGSVLLKLTDGAPETVWQSKALRTQMNPGVLFQGHVYGIDGDAGSKGPLVCLEFATGKLKWSERGFGPGAILVAANKLLVLSGQGELVVAKVSPDKFEPIARAQVLGGKCWTAPVLVNGRIYCRNTAGDLVCLDVQPKPGS